MCLIAQSHILKFITDCMKIMSPVDVARYDESYRVTGFIRMMVWVGFSRNIAKTLMPGYTPHDYDVSEALEGLSARLSADATSVT